MIDFFWRLLVLASIPYGILWIGKLLWRKKGEDKNATHCKIHEKNQGY